MSILDFDRLSVTPAESEPFRYLVATELIAPEALAEIRADFPPIKRAGIFPLSELRFGPAFARLIGEIRGSEMETALADKFDIDLTGKPLMITVRGHCRKKDGRIHTDTECKLVTALLYLNEPWEEGSGRLRLLRGPDDLDDMIGEVPPNGGTLLAFRRSDKSYHGHRPFVGERRYVMFNWISDEAAMQRELARHRLSARLKKYVPFA
ncbi:MAG: 2OG-Fe(II) oxygenase [Alphaproteobacteria bacterium]